MAATFPAGSWALASPLAQAWASGLALSLARVFWSLALSAPSALAALKASLSLVASSRFVLGSLGYFKNLLITHPVVIVKEKGNRGCLVPFVLAGPSLVFSLPVAVALYFPCVSF